MPPAPLTRDDVAAAFREMGEALARRRLVGEIAVYGGAAAMLRFDVSPATRDVDALISEAHGALQEAAREVARRRGWHPGRLGEAASTPVGSSPAPRSHGVFPSESRPGLRAYLVSPDHPPTGSRARRARTREARGTRRSSPARRATDP